YTSHAFNRSIASHVSTHQYIRPYTPRHNGKIERYNRIEPSRVWCRFYMGSDSRLRVA
ncbi:Ribonuclease H-like domain, partial [Propionibacterium ruminifibrarum]